MNRLIKSSRYLKLFAYKKEFFKQLNIMRNKFKKNNKSFIEKWIKKN